MQSTSANFENKKLLTAISVLIILAFFLNLNSYQLLFEEPRRALVALEMMLAGNPIVPTTNGVTYFNKPPLYNWVLIAFFKTFGTAEWVVRLPSILSLFITGISHYLLCKKYIGKQAALLSALFYITSADILFYFSLLGEIDLFYAMIVYLQGMLIFHFYQKRNFALLFLISYLLTTAGVLTKGIPSLFFQAITLLVIFILNKDYKKLFSIWHFLGIILLGAITGAYFYIYTFFHDPAPYLARLFTETFSRTGMERTWQDSLAHLINFPVMLIKITAPWLLIFLIVRKTPWREKFKENPFLLFCCWFCLANGILYLLSPGTRERYLYMFLPFIFSVLSFSIVNYKSDEQIWFKRFYLFIGSAIVLGLIGMGVYGFTLSKSISSTVSILLAAAVVWILLSTTWKSNISFILASIAFILIGRIGFDLVILPTKKQHETYRADAQKMAAIIQNEPVYLIGDPQEKTDEVKFAGVHFDTYNRNEPTYLAFQTSYYLSSSIGSVLLYTNFTDLNGFYIAREEFIENKSTIKTYFRFNNQLNKQDQWYVLFKRKQ